jgi:uncharacterized protein (DUF2141 family)
MRSAFLVLLFLFGIPLKIFTQANLTVEIIELKNNTGKIMFQLFDETEKIIYREIGNIENKKCVIIVKGLKTGKYAVRYYHDENQSMELETNFVGKPLEGYGFSNNVTAKFGPPAFEKWIFELKNDMKISLKPVY